MIKKILIVEDDAIVCNMLKKVLLRHEIDVCRNSHDALDKLSQKGPEYDYIILDLDLKYGSPIMGENDTSEVVAYFIADNPGIKSRIIIYSGDQEGVKILENILKDRYVYTIDKTTILRNTKLIIEGE